MSVTSIQTRSYCSPVQDRMAAATPSVYELTSIVRGKYVYKSVLTPLTDKTLRAS